MQDLNKKNKRREPSIQNRFEKIRGKWWFTIIAFCVGAAVVAIFHNKIFPPEIPNPDIKITYNYFKTAPRQLDFSGAVHLDYEADEKVSGLLIFIHNQGKEGDKNFEFNIYTRHEDIKLKPATILYEPTLLHVIGNKDYNDGKNGCYRKLETFPIDSEIYIEIFAETAINEGDIDFEFLSDHKKWTAIEGEINFKRGRGFLGGIEIFKEAFAEQAQNETNQKKSPSGVLIGGYDPLIMTNNLFKVLQEEKLLTRQQAQEIKIIVEAEKKGVLFGGVNILKFNEVALNALIRNDVFSKDEALDILQKSKDSGGVLIGGYNIVVLEVEILNLLVKKGKLDLQKAQSAVDNAKGINKN